jgi:tetratricopeptide (TPR) repeat protein
MTRSGYLLASFLAVVVSLGHGVAQGLPAEAEAALRTGEALMEEALETYPAQYPDRPLWQQAFAEGRRAEQFAPESLAPVRFLAEAYSRSHWTGRAWQAWMAFVDRGGVLDEEARDLVALVGHELGYGAYARGDLENALDTYLTVSDLVPDDIASRVWAGRILMETERPAQAVPFWRSVLELDPTDARAAYFVELAREQATWGTRAVEVFREGIALYEQGAPQAAAERFARAATINPTYPDAWSWLGRVAFEAGDYLDARRAYANAAGLAPDDETYRYFLAQSIARAEAESSDD